jgi:hypothetical protein
MSCISVSVYVYDTYIPIDYVSRVTYLTCSCTFAVEYIFKLTAANEWWLYMFWHWSLIDVASIVYGITYYTYTSLGDDLSFVRLLRIIQVGGFVAVGGHGKAARRWALLLGLVEG